MVVKNHLNFFVGEGEASSSSDCGGGADHSSETIGTDGTEGSSRGLNPEASEREITEHLVASRWSEAVSAYKRHAVNWPDSTIVSSTLSEGSEGGSCEDWHGVGSRSVEDDVHSMLNLLCKHLQANVIDQSGKIQFAFIFKIKVS